MEIINQYIDNRHIDLDRDLALYYLGGSIDAYKTFIQTFIDNYSSFSNICELINKDNKVVELIIHKIKGFSLYFGSKELYNFSIYLLDNVRKNKLISSNLIKEIEIFKELLDLLIVQFKNENR